jgi:hypothetical protein
MGLGREMGGGAPRAEKQSGEPKPVIFIEK